MRPNEERASGLIETTPGSAVRISASVTGLEDSCNSDVVSPLEHFKHDFARSDSVSTSGIGSEISDHDLLTSGSWEMNESGSIPDDGVFSYETGAVGLKSPCSSRQLQVTAMFCIR